MPKKVLQATVLRKICPLECAWERVDINKRCNFRKKGFCGENHQSIIFGVKEIFIFKNTLAKNLPRVVVVDVVVVVVVIVDVVCK